MPVVALGPDFCGQLREGEALLGLVTGQEVAQRDGQEYFRAMNEPYGPIGQSMAPRARGVMMKVA